MAEPSFISPREHFDLLVAKLPAKEQELFKNMKNTRAEAAYVGRSFVIYEIKDRKPAILDQVSVLDFMANHETGTSCEVYSQLHSSVQIVGYQPTQLWKYPIFMHLPLHGKLRWSTVDGAEASLAFDILIRTQSRFSLRERKVIYCEPGIQFEREFNNDVAGN